MLIATYYASVCSLGYAEPGFPGPELFACSHLEFALGLQPTHLLPTEQRSTTKRHGPFFSKEKQLKTACRRQIGHKLRKPWRLFQLLSD